MNELPPILTERIDDIPLLLEPRSLASLKIELVDNREAETWKKHWGLMLDSRVVDLRML